MLAIDTIKLEDRTDTLDMTNLRDNKPEFIILHSTYSYPEFEDILTNHREKGWAGMGYNLFVSNLNKVSQGRPFDKEGAHAWGFNTNSIGICFYASNGDIDKSKIEIGKEIIDNLKEKNEDLKIIPHTLSQVIYNNRLFKQFGIDKQFPETVDVVNEELFQEIKSDMDYLVGRLSTSKYFQLKQSLKHFKNCPGPLFYNFI